MNFWCHENSEVLEDCSVLGGDTALLWYLITSVSQEPADCFFKVEDKGSKRLQVLV